MAKLSDSNIDLTDIDIYSSHAASASVHFIEADIDHANIQSIGTNTHTEIDSHIASAGVHFTEASIDHANIQSIGTSTHTEIDSHIASAGVHFTEGSITHDNLNAVDSGTYRHLTAAQVTDLTDGNDTTLHDHDGISENTTHRSSDGADHSRVLTNSQHVSGDGSDHADVATNTAAKHTQGTDTTLGTVTADIDMDGSFQVVNLQAPDTAGDALRQTVNITEADLEQLTDGSDTTLHDHDGISENTSDRHTQGTDTTLGTVTADIDMDGSFQVVGLQAPANAGEALRQTVNITEADLEQLTDGSDTVLHDHDGISENTGVRHTQGTDTTLGTMTGTLNMGNNVISAVGSVTISDNGDNEGFMGPSNAWGLHHPEVAQGGYDAVEITIDDPFQIRNAATLRLQLTTAGSLSLTSGTGINEFSTDDTLGGNSDDAIPTEQAVKAYVDGEIAGVGGTIAGLVSRPKFSYKDSNEVYISAGLYHHSGSVDQYVYWDAILTKVVAGTLGAFGYLYIDDSAVVTLGDNELTATQLLFSITAPTWSETKHGWYNGLDRCIWAAQMLTSSTHNKFFHSSNLVSYANAVEDLAAANIGTTWVDVTLTIPAFCIDAQITNWFNNAGQSNQERSFWRTNGLTGPTFPSTDAGHRMGASDSDGQSQQVNTTSVITDSTQKIEIIHDSAGDQLSTIDTNGWYFPVGM